MPLKAYVGLPRAGKSYEVVVNVILPALAQGRRVVSNIAGLNYDAMCQVLYKEGYPQQSIGTLISIQHSQVDDPFFWRTDTDDAAGIETFLQPGDLLALDEIWRFWKKRGPIHDRAMNFFRMHGHMTHPSTGLTCEIALITQSIRDINENIKDVIQETFQMVKNTKLGSDKSYIVHIYQRGSTSKVDFIRTLSPRFYSPDFFPLYKSHSQHKDGDAAASEKNPDDRANILKGGFFKIGIPLALVLLGFGIYSFIGFFNPKSPKVSAAAVSPASASSVLASPVLASSNSVPPPVSDTWLVIGYFITTDGIDIVIKNSSNKIRYLHNPPNYKLTSSTLEVVLPEGGFATTWATLQKQQGVMLP